MSIPISEHFSLGELTVTSQTDEWGSPLVNSPGAAELHCLRALCVFVLEPVRELIGCPMRITSAFRSREVELRVSGKDWGQHRKGEAADWIALGNISLDECFERIVRSDLPFDQVIRESQPATGARWIHISHSERQTRRMALVTEDGGKTYAYYTQHQPEETA